MTGRLIGRGAAKWAVFDALSGCVMDYLGSLRAAKLIARDFNKTFDSTDRFVALSAKVARRRCRKGTPDGTLFPY
jgi:hypothetical protein